MWRKLILAILLIVAGALAFLLLRPQTVAANSIERLPEYQNAALLKRAWALPTARLYGPEDYSFQSNPSFCGPTSIGDLLRSEGKRLAPDKVLDSTGIHPIFGLLLGGLTLDQEAAVLRQRTGKPVIVERGLSLSAFETEMARSNDPSRRYIVNFTREPLFGRGHGHFSPVLGYMPRTRLVFVGDVNAHYRPWLVPLVRLYDAQNTIDPSTHAKRGLLAVAVR